MRRVARILAVLAIAAAGVLATTAPAIAGTDDFTITSFTADYYLDRDAEGHSTLRTVETIVAQFPDFDQNHGIERYLPDDYQGHPTNISIESVTDEHGFPIPYESESDDEFVYMRIGDADFYVRGTHTYVITYTTQNVTLFDGDVEDFYWDVNGTGWAQTFGSVVGRVHISEELATHLNGDTRCYVGTYGSQEECAAPVPQDDGSEVTFEVSAYDLPSYSNVTFAIGFTKGTFEPRDNSAFASAFFIPELLASALAVIVAIFALVRRFTTFADAPGRPTIVAEYLPPNNASPLMAGIATKRKKKAVAAQLVSYAVNHNIRIIESPATGFFATGNEYTLELLDASKLDREEAWLAQAFFGDSLTPGTQYTIKKSDTTVGKKVYELVHGLEGDTDKRGWHKKVPIGSRFLPALISIAAGVLTFVFFILMIDDARGGWIPAIVLIPSIISFFIVMSVISRKPYTEQGAELRDYLKGMELYIGVAETDRLRMLQSPQGAERAPVDTTDRGQMLKLYERVLPFAVLFGQEKEWAKQLGEYYGDQPPEWYSGTSAFNSAMFASSIGSIASTSAGAYSGTSSSSSGSGGGGSSGGGGGGGGGGGW